MLLNGPIRYLHCIFYSIAESKVASYQNTDLLKLQNGRLKVALQFIFRPSGFFDSRNYRAFIFNRNIKGLHLNVNVPQIQNLVA